MISGYAWTLKRSAIPIADHLYCFDLSIKLIDDESPSNDDIFVLANNSIRGLDEVSSLMNFDGLSIFIIRLIRPINSFLSKLNSISVFTQSPTLKDAK
jgi:hypothetical protein